MAALGHCQAGRIGDRLPGGLAQRCNVLVDAEQLSEVIVAADVPAAPDGVELRQTAVFMLLADREQTNVLLIRRADRGDAWSSHIAFPGGHVEPADADTLATAYRETYEEVGIEREAITRLGDLGHFQTNAIPVDLHVFVGRWNAAGPLRLDPVEVAQAIEVPLSWLLRQHDQRGYRGQQVEALGEDLVYPLGDTCIWGVTARIIHFFIELIADSPIVTGGDGTQ